MNVVTFSPRRRPSLWGPQSGPRSTALKLPISMTVRTVFQSGNTGLAVADWTITGTGPDGNELALAGTTADVASFDEEHGWRYVVDNPFGTA